MAPKKKIKRIKAELSRVLDGPANRKQYEALGVRPAHKSLPHALYAKGCGAAKRHRVLSIKIPTTT